MGAKPEELQLGEVYDLVEELAVAREVERKARETARAFPSRFTLPEPYPLGTLRTRAGKLVQEAVACREALEAEVQIGKARILASAKDDEHEQWEPVPGYYDLAYDEQPHLVYQIHREGRTSWIVVVWLGSLGAAWASDGTAELRRVAVTGCFGAHEWATLATTAAGVYGRCTTYDPIDTPDPIDLRCVLVNGVR